MKHHSSFKIHSLKETNQEAGLLYHFGWDQKHLDLNVSEEGGRHNSEEWYMRKGPQYLKMASLGRSLHCISKLTFKPAEAALRPCLKPGYGLIILKLTII